MCDSGITAYHSVLLILFLLLFASSAITCVQSSGEIVLFFGDGLMIFLHACTVKKRRSKKTNAISRAIASMVICTHQEHVTSSSRAHRTESTGMTECTRMPCVGHSNSGTPIVA